MRRIIFLLAFIALAGCANHPMRTGKIFVNQFETKEYTTNDPAQGGDDAARISNDLYKALLVNIPKYTKMTIAKDCNDGDFELVGQFEKLNINMDSNWQIIKVTVNQNFDIGVAGVLKACKADQVIESFNTDSKDTDISKLIENISKDIVEVIK